MSRLYLCLGRTGDIINILPLLWSDAQAGLRSQLMVAKEFAGLLEGCSYLDPVIFDGDFMEIDRAVEQAKTLSDDIRVCQLAGPRNDVLKLAYERVGLHVGDPQTEAYNKEAWRLAGRFNDWRLQHQLVFDRRNPEREKLLMAMLPKSKKKQFILVAVDSISSPFKHKTLLMELLRLKFGRSADIVDLSKIRADRIYDLLGLFELAKCVVCADSAPLHLAYASKVPVVALVQDQPTLFFGSAWRPNHIFHCRYGDFTSRAVEMLEAISEIGKPGSRFGREYLKPKIVHVWSKYDIHPENSSRHEMARQSWREVYEKDLMVSCPVEVGAVGRDSQTVFKDEFRFPYVKDVIRNASLRADDDDTILLTRADTCLTDGFLIEGQVVGVKPLYGHRKIGDDTLPQVDLFAFSKKWWRENQDLYPDMVLGHDPSWWLVMKELIKLKGGSECSDLCYREKGSMVQVNNSSYRGLNSDLAKGFMDQHGIIPGKPKISEQVKMVTVNDKSLFPGGYNPSIIGFDGKLLMAYRFHPDHTLATTLAIAELDDQFNVRSNQRILMDGNFDDPRLFTFGGRLWMGFVKTRWPDSPACVMVYGQLAEAQGRWHLVSSFQVNYGKNDFTGMEKNWLFFNREMSFFSIYGSRDQQLVLELSADKVVNIHKSPEPKWRWGEIRGGCLLPWKGKLLRFFHSRTDTDPLPLRWRYYCGCLVMEPEPPFTVLQVCKEPIAVGSEYDDLTGEEVQRYFHRKQNVIFPAGCVSRGDEILLSVGINDAACGIIRLAEADLKL